MQLGTNGAEHQSEADGNMKCSSTSQHVRSQLAQGHVQSVLVL